MKSLVKKLDDMEISQGSSFSIKFNFKSNEYIDLSDYEAWFLLSQYGQEDYVEMKKQCNLITDTTTYRVTLTENDTKDLQGAYSFEVVLKDANGRKVENGRGIMHVLKSGMAEIGV